MKYITLALFVYLIITVALLVGPAKSFQAATSLDWWGNPQNVSAFDPMEDAIGPDEDAVPIITFKTPVVTIPAPPYVIVDPVD